MLRGGAGFGLLLAIGLTACADADNDARRAWLRSTLTDDNRDLLWRSPDLVAGKYAKMSLTPYAFLRGTVMQWIRDLTEPGLIPLQTSFGSPAAARVLLNGDPHPENIGSYMPADGEITVEFNDFDAARYGPYWSDVWRMAQGFEVIARGAPAHFDEAAIEALVRAVATGYHAQIVELDGGAAPLRIANQAGYGTIVDDLMRRAVRDGDIREELLEYSRVQDGLRILFRGDIAPITDEDPVGERVVDVEADLRAEVEALLAGYRSTLVDSSPGDEASLRIKDIARQIGSGVSSFALYRFYVLVEGPTEALDDDWLLEAKEIRDPARFPGVPIFPSRQNISNAQRVVQAQRSMQLIDDADPLLGFSAHGSFSLRVRHRTKYQKGLDSARIWEKLDEGDFAPSDVLALADLAGRLLARTHTRAPLANGEPALPAVRAAIGDDPAAFADEVARVSATYTQRILDDYALFLELLETEGPLLGYRTPL